MVKVLKLTECLCNKYYVKGSSGRGRQHELKEGELREMEILNIKYKQMGMLTVKTIISERKSKFHAPNSSRLNTAEKNIEQRQNKSRPSK